MSTHNKSLLLHCCCAPCSILPLRELAREGYDLLLYYSNANIHPKAEYELRLNTLAAYIADKDLPLQEGEYDPIRWEQEVGVLGGPYPLIQDDENYSRMLEAKMQRCAACYQLRFEALATTAAEQGITHIASTLTISPYQFNELINQTLEEKARAYGLHALRTDWRSLYQDATLASRELGMYRQNYCGCHFSKEEAALEREARKLARKNKKAPS